MAHEVVWSPRAIEDVEAIAIYISADSTAYAAAVVKNPHHHSLSQQFSLCRSRRA